MSRFTSFSLSQDSPVSVHRTGDGAGMPDISDLSARIRFSPHEGQVWLDDQRVVMFNIAWLIAMRRELVETLGPRKARETMFRMGYAAGTREALIALKMRQDKPQIDGFLVGPQLHSLRGEVCVEPVSIEGDAERGRYYSELIWRNSSEAECHVACFGGSSEPVCWSQIGYASGYTSAVMERPIIFEEVECVACGDPTCRIIGKPAEEWPKETGSVLAPHAILPAASGDRDVGETPVGVIGASPGFLGAWYLLKRVAPMSTTVLLQGETGVGKEIFARALHDESPRARKPMLSINCAAIPESLMDSELFGVERGAYTGANHSRPGWFEAADGSTLFLDEIGTLNLTAQAKLLRVIQEGQFSRVGGTTTRKVDVRLICATNMDLEDEVRRGNLRLDLLHRLNVFPISIPPLRERRDDIPPLIQYFLV
ncbi:MAG: sigma 54-interacting transcriptional regulator, partial [Sphingomonas sp.]|nr:sigma 54-interacting transcriptional regulator [Sphingomonas sp.]